MLGKIYGYIRVSTKEQNEGRQRIAMEAYGVPEENVYMDKQSGKDFDRPGYRALMEVLDEGDLFVIKSIDRLGRDFDEILEQWRIITKDKGAGIIVLDMPILNTGLQSDLLGRVVAEMMLTLMSYMAETERENIRQRQAEGIAVWAGGRSRSRRNFRRCARCGKMACIRRRWRPASWAWTVTHS